MKYTSHSVFRFIKLPFGVLFIVLFIQLVGARNCKAQKKIEIIKSDKLEGGKVDGQNIRKLIGNVELRHKNQTLLCDSAYQFIKKKELRAYGNIEIKNDTMTIWADTANYFTKKEISNFSGRVIIHNKKTTIFSKKATYNFKTHKAFFPVRILLKDKKGTLLAQNGIYYSKKDSAIFRGNVQIVDSTQYAEADSLFSNRKSGFYKLYGRVFIHDSKNHVYLKGDYIQADSSGYRLLKGHAIMEKLKNSKKDTSFIWAHSIHYWEHDSTYIFKGYGDVHIWTRKFSSISDTATYADSTHHFKLISKAKAWYKHLQLTAPRINVKLEKDTVKSLTAYPHPFAVQEDTLTKRLNQVKGDSIFAKFKRGNVSSILVYPNGKLLYFTKNEQNKPDGAIQMTADSLLILFKKGSIHQVRALKNINGNYLAKSPNLAKQKLNGFSWDPKQKPLKPSKQLRQRLPAIPTKLPFPLPLRYEEFLQKESIHKIKKVSKLHPAQHSP